MTITNQQKDDTLLLDVIKEGFELQSDAELAGFLGITRGAISTVRHKTHRLSPGCKFIVLDKIAFMGVRNWVERVSGVYIGRRLHELSINQAQRVGQKNIPHDNLEEAEKSLPDEIKQAFNIQKDEDLADFLDIKRNTISMVRKGKSKLGLEPKLILLQRIDLIDSNKVITAINDPDILIEAIRTFSKTTNK